MRTLPRCRAIPVVFFTSSRNPQDIRRAYDSGAAGYIAKPFSLREYRSRLKGLVEYWTNTCLLPGRENT